LADQVYFLEPVLPRLYVPGNRFRSGA